MHSHYPNSKPDSPFHMQVVFFMSVKGRESQIFSQGLLSGVGKLFLVSFLVTFLIGLEHMHNYSSHITKYRLL